MKPLVSAIVLAAGKGLRMGLGQNKVLASLGGKPVLTWSLALLENNPLIGEIIVATGAEEVDICRRIVGDYPKVVKIIIGGQCRQESVGNALMAVNSQYPLVLIHDGARPLLTDEQLRKVVLAANDRQGAILAVPVKNTIKQADWAGYIEATLTRDLLWEAQTPQVFPYQPLYEAYMKAQKGNIAVTDDASLLENIGFPVQMIKGGYENFKLTTPEDWLLAEEIIKDRSKAKNNS